MPAPKTKITDNISNRAINSIKDTKQVKEKPKFSKIHGYECKTSGEELIVKGYIATTHLDNGFYDSFTGEFTKDRIAKETLFSWANDINNGIPRANKVSVNHEREPHVTGVGVKGTAKVHKLPDGEYGLYVESFIDKTKETFEDVAYRIENDLLDSFSIEFTTRDALTGDYLPGSVQITPSGDGMVRTLLPATELEGWTLASQPMNPQAIMLKEIIKKKEHKEVNPMKEEIKVEVKEEVEEQPTEPVVETTEEAPAEEKPVEEVKEAINSAEVKVSAQDAALLKEIKELKATEKKEKERKEIVDRVKNELKESLKTVEVENKVKTNKEVECKELVEFKNAIEGKEVSVDAQFAMAGEIANKAGLTIGGLKLDSRRAESREFKNFSTNGRKMEFKSLGITTNQNSDTDYLLSAAELADVFDPIIYNSLNQKTTTWNLLAKDDFSSKGNNQVQFSLKTAANTTAAAYLGNAVNTGNVTRQKYMTKFKKYQVGVEVNGDMIASARGGPIGDVFAQEVKDSTDDLMAVINLALFDEVGLETAAGVIGFEYLADSAGNTSLYNLTRSAANRLAPDSAGNTYIDGSSADVTVTNLRAQIRNAIEEGADMNNLVFIVSPIQHDKIKGIYDAAQRLIPTSSRFGFEGMMQFDGVPVFYDKDCNDDDIFLIDLETHRVAIWVPPTLEMLGKDSDSTKGFIKTYFATYNRDPRRISMQHSLATS